MTLRNTFRLQSFRVIFVAAAHRLRLLTAAPSRGESPLLMLWTAPPAARECHGCEGFKAPTILQCMGRPDAVVPLDQRTRRARLDKRRSYAAER